MKLRTTVWLTGAAFAALALGLIPQASRGGETGLAVGPAIAQAQDFGYREVTGVVLDKESSAVSGATVFLKNLKTKSIRSFTSTDKGAYQFVQVSKNIDFELWAEKGAEKSDVKTVSTWDDRKQFVANLVLKK